MGSVFDTMCLPKSAQLWFHIKTWSPIELSTVSTQLDIHVLSFASHNAFRGDQWWEPDLHERSACRGVASSPRGVGPPYTGQNSETKINGWAGLGLMQPETGLFHTSSFVMQWVFSSCAEIFSQIPQERKKRRRFDDEGRWIRTRLFSRSLWCWPGPEPKRQRTPMEALQAWANEWPDKERVVGILAIRSGWTAMVRPMYWY